MLPSPPAMLAPVMASVPQSFCDDVMSQLSSLTAIVMADREFQVQLSLRLDALISLQQRNPVADAQPVKVVWDCPVCREPMSHLRSFKGHIKRLYEVYFSSGVLDNGGAYAPQGKRCLLRSGKLSHVNLVSRSGPPGSNFAERSKAFAAALWLYVQGIPSEDDPDVMLQFMGTVSDAVFPRVNHDGLAPGM